MQATQALSDARAALDRGEWRRARDLLAPLAAGADEPEVHEALAHALRYLGEFNASLRHRERAFDGYRARGERRAAGRAATWLAYDRALLRGEISVARGWFSRAARLLDGEQTPEQGLLAFCRGRATMLLGGDAVAAREDGVRARRIGEAVGDVDLEILGLTLEGLARVRTGEVAAGMGQLDEAAAAAVGGELAAATNAGTVCCAVIGACESVQDLDRAAQWCGTLEEYCARAQVEELFAFCRSHMASVLLARGLLADAERHLQDALEAFARGAPALRYDGLVRLAMLRCLQGRHEEMLAICDEVAWHPSSVLCRARAAFQEHDVAEAGRLVDRYLQETAPDDRLGAVVALELRARVAIASGEPADAVAAAARLADAAAVAGTGMMAAAAALVRGLAARAAGDPRGARDGLEEAVARYLGAGAAVDAARARTDLGELLLAEGRPAEAARELAGARAVLAGCGADGLVPRLDALLDAARPAPAAPPRGDGPLTARELEVLRLAASGMSDGQIAARLVLSEHTVHRHMANIRAKLGRRTRAAAVARAAADGLI